MTTEAGLEGDDHKGLRFPRRQVTLLAAEDWSSALSVLGVDDTKFSWIARRANVLTQGLRLPRAIDALIQIGTAVVLEVTGQTVPCRRMDEAFDGLRRALGPEWRGGVTCRVVAGGRIARGDAVTILSSPPERTRRLP